MADVTPIHRMRLDNRTYAEYEVLRYEFENDFVWAFTEQRVAVVKEGQRYEFPNEPEKLMTYPKKRKCGQKKERRDGELVNIDLFEPTSPPPFLNELKLEAYDDERIHLEPWEVDQLRQKHVGSAPKPEEESKLPF